MKQLDILSLSALLLIGSAAGSAHYSAFSKSDPEYRQLKARLLSESSAALKAPASQTLLDEDFSKFSDGSESSPAASEIEYENVYHIPDAMTAQPGWTGGGVHSAGGAVALMRRPGQEGSRSFGFISTPPANLYGTATLTLRARKLNADSSAFLWVALCDDYNGPGYDTWDQALSADWQTYTFIAKNAYADELSYFQLQAMEGEVLIDDVRLDFVRDKIAAPYANEAKNNSLTSFTASWEDTGISSYIFNAYRLEDPENAVSGTLTADMESLSTKPGSSEIDPASVPDGWTLEGAPTLSTEAGNFLSGKQGMVFGTVDDRLTSPETPEDITDISFWAKPSQMTDDDYSLSLLSVLVYVPERNSWEALANIPYYYLAEEGLKYTLNAEAIGPGARRVRLEFIQKGIVTFAVDDVEISYATAKVKAPVVKDAVVTETSYTVDNIDPELDHYYYVQAAEGELVSDSSNEVWVDGLRGLKPVLSEPTGVTNTGFTANWERMPHADNYIVEGFRITTASTEIPDVVIIEEDFNLITDGTVTNPSTDWISPYDFGANGKAHTSWGATNPAWAAGMAGTLGTNYWMGTAGLVYSPMLDLSNNGGNGFDVEFTAYATMGGTFQVEGSDGNIYEDTEGIFAMVLTSPFDSQALAAALLDVPEPGTVSGKLHIAPEQGTDLSNVIVAFMTKSGTAFFIDDVKITQTLLAGESVSRPFASITTDKTSCTFSNLPTDSDHGYAVTASRYKNYITYASQRSDMKEVLTSNAGITVPTDSNMLRIFGGNGCVIASAPVAMTVFDMSGRVIAASSESATRLHVAPGIYAVKAEGKVFKVAVK